VTERKKKPEPVADILANFLAESGLAPRVEQAAVIPEWPELVGEQIAAVTATVGHGRRHPLRGGDDQCLDDRAIATGA
jgi:hypothetical protein